MTKHETVILQKVRTRNIEQAASDMQAQQQRRAARRDRYLAYLTALHERKKKNDKNR